MALIELPGASRTGAVGKKPDIRSKSVPVQLRVLEYLVALNKVIRAFAETSHPALIPVRAALHAILTGADFYWAAMHDGVGSSCIQ